MVHAALKQAVYVRDILLSHSEEAVNSLKTGQLSQAFADVTDTIIMLAGTVGGYGGVMEEWQEPMPFIMD